MGRSSACLRIIACGCNSGEGNIHDSDPRVPDSEVKKSRDKSGWSFRKNSEARVLRNSVITERATYEHQENPDESATFSSQCIGSSHESRNACLTQCRDNKVQLVVTAKSFVSECATNVENGKEFVAKFDEISQESAVVTVQAAVRGFLARRKLLKLKDVIQLRPEVQRHNPIEKSCTSLENTVELNSSTDQQERDKSKKLENSPGVSLISAPEATESMLEKQNLVPSESEENLIIYEGEKINFHPCRDTDSVVEDGAQQASSEVDLLSNSPKRNNLKDTKLISGGSKFDELAQMVNPGSTTLVGSTHHSSGVSTLDNVPFNVDLIKEEKILWYVGSECGTELSISSTLDSPDRSEEGVIIDGQGKEVQYKGTGNFGEAETIDAKAEDLLTSPSTGLIEKHVGNLDRADEDSDGSVVSIDVSQIEKKFKINTSDAEKELVFQEKPLSQEASSRSRELLQTPSSQVSTKSTRDKPNKLSPKKNHKLVSSDKKSPSKPNQEQSPKDPASGKKRDSFGSDQEHRNSTSSNSLPHFMQATESARAKLQANNGSPKSSPDVQERDINAKKRHSLPGANVKQVSPRILQSRKERKWQR